MEYEKNAGGIFVALPSSRDPVMEWSMSMAAMNYPIGMPYHLYPVIGSETGEARNMAVEKAIEVGAKYIWFVDDDTAPPIYAVRKLLYVLDQEEAKESKVRVCAGIYFTKEDPPLPIVFKEKNGGPFWKWKVGDVFECCGIGTGCMMVRVDIFKELPKPWFKTVDIEPTSVSKFKDMQTDDIYFCDKVLAAGYKILAHGGVIPLHWNSSRVALGELERLRDKINPASENLADDTICWKAELDSIIATARAGKRFFGLPVDSYPAIDYDGSLTQVNNGVVVKQ